jgi:uncharacterized membrane protein (DUF106 family)
VISSLFIITGVVADLQVKYIRKCSRINKIRRKPMDSLEKMKQDFLKKGGKIEKLPTIPLEMVIRERQLMKMGAKIYKKKINKNK